MKTKLVLWGSDAEDKRILIAMELRPEDNKVDLYIFSEAIATDEFAQRLLNQWRKGESIDFPEGYTHRERELSVTEGLLPDDLKVERTDIVNRAQTEWHFIVLSAKLNKVYQTELEGLKQKIGQLSRYDSSIWEELKSFWNKVQDQVRDRNLFKEHADSLRDNTNELFAQMKVMRNKLDEEFKMLSKANVDKFFAKLDDVEKRIGEGLRLQSVFEDLKQLQRRFREAKFTKDDRSSVWKRLDGAFKVVKEKRFGPNANARDSGPMERLNRRYEGLIAAIAKMHRSIQRDNDDLEFQRRKIASTDGQLEAQIRQAKIKMIEERVRSKREKLNEMENTKVDLEKRILIQKDKEAKRQERIRLEAAKQEAQDKIKEQMKAAAKARKKEEEKLKAAAEALNTPKAPQEESIFDAVKTTLEESFEDMVDTVKAVAEVVGDKLEEAVEDFKEATIDKKPEATIKTEAPNGVVTTSETVTEDANKVVNELTETVEDKANAPAKAVETTKMVAETVNEGAEKTAEAAGNAVELAKDSVDTVTEDANKAVNDLTETIKDKANVAVEKTAEVAGDGVAVVEDAVETVIESTDEVVSQLAEAAEDKTVAEAVEEIAQEVAETVEETVTETVSQLTNTSEVIANPTTEALEVVSEEIENKE